MLRTVAVENDYNLLVFNLNGLAEELVGLKLEVDRRLLQEKRDGLEPNATNWVNLISQRMTYVEGPAFHLKDGAWKVLTSRPGEPVFTAEPPPAPDAPV
jgi:hypothetical protein